MERDTTAGVRLEEKDASFSGGNIGSSPVPRTILKPYHPADMPPGERAAWANGFEAGRPKQLLQDLIYFFRGNFPQVGLGEINHQTREFADRCERLLTKE